jgi:hypothetical protein
MDMIRGYEDVSSVSARMCDRAPWLFDRDSVCYCCRSCLCRPSFVSFAVIWKIAFVSSCM